MDALILSNALDTNGQNRRYVEASKKWGTDKGVLKALAVGTYDPAGVVGRFQVAAEKYGSLKIRSAHRSTHIYQQMPADLMWSHKNHREIRQLAEDADILHLNNSTIALRRLGLSSKGKGVLLHHHGSLFRSDPGTMLKEALRLGAVSAVSTVDLMQVAPNTLHWLPTAYDIDWLESFGAEHRRQSGGPIRVISAPTNRGFKSTAELEAAVAKLQAEGADIELVIVEGKPWLEAMAIKATADIYFDQAILGYGCNAVEAWGMGIPVIAGANPWTLAKMRELFGKLPFYETTPDTIADAIKALMNKRTRTTYAKRGMAHVRKWHDERPALQRLASLYHATLEAPPQEDVIVPPATFTALIPQIRVGNRSITFSNGPVTIDNPYLAIRVRQYALRHPGARIEEVA